MTKKTVKSHSFILSNLAITFLLIVVLVLINFIFTSPSYEKIEVNTLNENETISYFLTNEEISNTNKFNLNYLNNTCTSLSLNKHKNKLNISCEIYQQKDINVYTDNSSDLLIQYANENSQKNTSLASKQNLQLILIQNTYIERFKYNIDDNTSTLSVKRFDFKDDFNTYKNKVNLNLLVSLQFAEKKIREELYLRNNITEYYNNI
jgi:hypothetical protein